MTVEVRLRGDDGTETLSFDAAAADRLVRPTSLELLRTVAREEPSSIREAARLVGRDVRQVHDDLWNLGQMGLVEFDRGGRSHRPLVEYERIEVGIEV
jgi:predicted transcriptional regulator